MAPALPPRDVDPDKALTIAAGTAVAACVVVWAAAQLATRLETGDWLGLPILDAPRLVAHLALQPDHPLAWTPPGSQIRPAVFYGVLGGLVVTAIVIAAFGWRAWRRHHPKENDEGARWAKPRDLKPLLVRRPQPGRLTLGTVNGRLIATEHQHSVCVIGPAGTGKTTGFAIPALHEWDGPVIATTVKADLVDHTINHRRNVGDVYVYDPTAATGHHSAGWSPLTASWDWQGALRTAANLVTTARTGHHGGLQDSDFWYAVAQKLLAPLLYAAATSGATMADVVRWIDLQEADEPIIALHNTGNTDAAQAFIATLNREERTQSSAYTTTETVLAAYADPTVLDTTTATPHITPEKLLDGGNHTLYISAPLDDQARLRPLFTALIEETITTVYRRAIRTDTALTKPLLLVIDEAANIAPLPNLAQIASTARGVGIQLVTIWQDFAQIQARYGTHAQTVINNHRAKIVLSGISDTPTLDYTSHLIGDHTTTEESWTSDGAGGRRSTTRSSRHRPLAPPSVLRLAPPGSGHLIYANLKPARLRLRQPPSTRRPQTTRDNI